MSLVPIRENDAVEIRRAIQKLSSTKLGPTSAVTFLGLTISSVATVSTLYVSNGIGIGAVTAIEAELDMRSSTDSDIWQTVARDNASANIYWRRAKGDLNSPSPITADLAVGALFGFGYDGNDYNSQVAGIVFRADADFSVDDTPGRIDFHTTPSGGNLALLRMTLDSSGVLNVGNAIITSLACASANISVLNVCYVNLTEETSFPSFDEGIMVYKDNELYLAKED